MASDTVAGRPAGRALSAIGVYGSATGATNVALNAGVYGTASGGTINYGGYFDTDVAIASGAHLISPVGTAPTTSCTTLTSGSSDTSGSVTTAGATTSCTVTFNKNWPVGPNCVCSRASTGAAQEAITDCEASTTVLTMNFTTNTNGATFNYFCAGHR